MWIVGLVIAGSLMVPCIIEDMGSILVLPMH